MNKKAGFSKEENAAWLEYERSFPDDEKGEIKGFRDLESDEVLNEWGNFGDYQLVGNGVQTNGVESGSLALWWNSSVYGGFVLGDGAGFNVHFNITDFMTTNPPLDWTNWFTGMWDTSHKALNVNLTLLDFFSGQSLENSFLIDSSASLWGASKVTKLHYSSMVNASQELSFPNSIDLGFYRSGRVVTAYMQFTNSGVTYMDNGTLCPVRLTNSYMLASDSSLFSGGLIVMLEFSHAGCGSFELTYEGSETNCIPAGWDATHATNEVAKQTYGILDSLAGFGMLFVGLFNIASLLIQNAPILLICFGVSMVVACVTKMSVEPLRQFVDFIWSGATAVVGAITGIWGAIKDAIQWW